MANNTRYEELMESKLLSVLDTLLLALVGSVVGIAFEYIILALWNTPPRVVANNIIFVFSFLFVTLGGDILKEFRTEKRRGHWGKLIASGGLAIGTSLFILLFMFLLDRFMALLWLFIDLIAGLL